MTLRSYDKPKKKFFREYKDPGPEMFSDEWYKEGDDIRKKHEEAHRNSHGHAHSHDPYYSDQKKNK